MFWKNIWTNFRTGIVNIGRLINKHLPTVLKGAKYITKWLEHSHQPVIAGAAALGTELLEWGEKAHAWYNRGMDNVENSTGDPSTPAIGID